MSISRYIKINCCLPFAIFAKKNWQSVFVWLMIILTFMISSICRLGSLPCARTFQFILQFPQKERAVSRYRTIRCTHISLSDNPFYILWVFLFQISNNLYLIKILNNNNNTPSYLAILLCNHNSRHQTSLSGIFQTLSSMWLIFLVKERLQDAKNI